MEEVLCFAIVRGFLQRRGMGKTLEAFDQEVSASSQPQLSRKDIAITLRIGTLVKKNAQRGELLFSSWLLVVSTLTTTSTQKNHLEPFWKLLLIILKIDLLQNHYQSNLLQFPLLFLLQLFHRHHQHKNNNDQKQKFRPSKLWNNLLQKDQLQVLQNKDL